MHSGWFAKFPNNAALAGARDQRKETGSVKRGDKEKREGRERGRVDGERKKGRKEKLVKGLKNGRNGYMERERERR